MPYDMTPARLAFRVMWRRARLEARKPISPEYVDTLESHAMGVAVLVRYDLNPCTCRRSSGITPAARRAAHLTLAGVARRQAATLTGFLRRLAVDDHRRHIEAARRA